MYNIITTQILNFIVEYINIVYLLIIYLYVCKDKNSSYSDWKYSLNWITKPSGYYFILTLYNYTTDRTKYTLLLSS